MNEDTVRGILKLAIAAVGFKLVNDWLQEEKRAWTPDDEISVVDAYYRGRLLGNGPRQRTIAERFQISQTEVSKTIRKARRDVWDTWSWKEAYKDHEGEVEHVAEQTGLQFDTVAVIVQLREGQGDLKVRRRHRADARQGKLL